MNPNINNRYSYLNQDQSAENLLEQNNKIK